MNKEDNSYGTLYVVATPIGNLGDMTFRAIETLKAVDLIAAEDTRHSRKLLNHYGIQTRMISCHEHNEIKKTPYLIEQLQNGLNLALISDAGTPGISDPGYPLVFESAKNNIRIVPLPGCSAATAGLSVSGLPTDSFLFAGFPPRKQQKLRTFLEQRKADTATLIFYESPKRIIALIQNCIDIYGDRSACLAREITKLHEEYLRGPLSSIMHDLEQRDSIKGECVLYVHGNSEKKTISGKKLEQLIGTYLSQGQIRTKDLAKKISREYTLSTKKVYDIILSCQHKTRP